MPFLQVSKELKALLDGDVEVLKALAAKRVTSVPKFLQIDQDTIDSLAVPQLKKDALRRLSQRDQVFSFLPGDLVTVESFATMTSSLETVLSALDFSSGDVLTGTTQKLQDGQITPEVLLSASMTSDRLKALGIALGPRKAILQRRDRELARYKVSRIRRNGLYEVTGESPEPRVVHALQMHLEEAGQLCSNLTELGFINRQRTSDVLLALKLESFAAGLDSPDGQKLIDKLMSSADINESDPSDAAPDLDESEVTAEDKKARQKLEGYAMVLAVLRSLREKRPFPAAFERMVSDALRSSDDSEPKWTWGPYEPTDMTVSEENLKVTKNYVTGPDYSCAIGSEALEAGVHSWEIQVENTKQSSYSMWLGIARGVEEHDGLGKYPSNESCDYVIAFGSGGSDTKVVAANGIDPSVESVSGHQYNPGQIVRFELDTEARTLQMSVDGVLAVVVSNVEAEGVRPYVCMDYSESALIVSRSFVRAAGADSVAPVTSAVSEEDAAAALDNVVWTEELDAAVLRLPAAGEFPR